MTRIASVFVALVLAGSSVFAQGAFRLSSAEVAEGATIKADVFTLYALSTEKVDLPANTTQALAGFTINGSKLATATMTALYGR